jgi:hypothetical protein
VVVQGLADELSREGACDMAIYPDENIVITSCAIEGFYEEGVIKGSSLSLSLSILFHAACGFVCSSAPVNNIYPDLLFTAGQPLQA